MQSKLPPLPKEAFDGESYSTKIEHVKCNHDDLVLGDGTLNCRKCHAGWMGHDVYKLYELMTQRKT